MLNTPIFTNDKKHRTKVAVYEAWLRRPAGKPAKFVEVEIANLHGISVSSVRRYVKEIEAHGYLPKPKPVQGRTTYAWSPQAIRWMKAYYLAASREVKFCSMRNAYRRTCLEAKGRGWQVGSEPSAYKHLQDLHTLLVEYTKGGTRALDNIFYIARDLSTLKPFEVIVGDQHIFDFWVVDDKGNKLRPQGYAWLDMRTRLVYGLSLECGSYNFRTVARSLRTGIERFGKFCSTYNDNGKPEISNKINWLVYALQTFGMKHTDEAELYKTENGKYAIEDEKGKVIDIAETPEVWHKKHRRIFAKVKNAKTKPIERFFSTLETLLLDQCLPGAVKDLTASAAEDEEATRRLNWQEKNGLLLHYKEFEEQVFKAVDTYESRLHSTLKRSPKQEMEYALKHEAWRPTFIAPEEVRYIFMEPMQAIVRNARVRVCGINFVGPNLTAQMVKENRGNLAGLNKQKITVRIDPDKPHLGAYAIDPRDGEAIYLIPEKKIDFFDEAEVKNSIEEKKHNIKAITTAYQETTSDAQVYGKVLVSSNHKKLDKAKEVTEKALLEEYKPQSISEEELAKAVGKLLSQEETERKNRQPVYNSQWDRYSAILDAMVANAPITKSDQEFKAEYEKTMDDTARSYFENKIEIEMQKKKELLKWN